MKATIGAGATVVLCLLLGIAGGLAGGLKGLQLAMVIALLALIGIAAAAAILYFTKDKPKPSAAAAILDPGGNSEIDALVREADRRLAQANAGAAIANLPLIFVIGDRGTAKTSTVVNSGIEPELLAGQVYQDNNVAPTRAANLWFARGIALVEAGGAILGDPANWMRLVKRLQPGRMKSLKGGTQSPRAVLLCVSLESFSKGTDAVAAATRYLQARLSEIAQTLGIRFPVYILYTKTDRLPFFTDFVTNFSNDEASQIFGVTVPILPAQQSGVYSQDETRRLSGYFDNLFYSLCDKRTIFPPRDNDLEKVCGAYEFPRELRKTRDALVQFMVDVCRPSQLTTSPFLRGFYFSGVRPVVVNEAAPVIAGTPQAQRPDFQPASGATGIFRVGKQAEMLAQQAVAQPVAASRRVPQWVFLGHLFNNIILGDTAALSASGASVKVSALRRGLLIAASVACLILATLFLVSYLGNHRLEQDAITAAQSIPAKDVPAGALAQIGDLQQLENLRQTLEKLDGYESDGAPYRLRWGLYQGSNMYPLVRKLYYARFHALLFGQTQDGLLGFMQKLKSPPVANADYNYPYNTLKGYLLTTSEFKHDNDQGMKDFLSSLLLERWRENRDAETKDLAPLAKKQFDYYARNLVDGNPYSVKGDDDAVNLARVYLHNFGDIQRKYHGMLETVAKKGKAKDFNREFDGSAATLISNHSVPYAFLASGAKDMLLEMQRANPSGDDWVLGPLYKDNSEQSQETKAAIRDLFTKDYIKEWRTVVGTSHVAAYKNLQDAADKLDKLTNGDKAMLELLAWASQNTTPSDISDVNDAFKVVHFVEPPAAAALVPSVQDYNQALQSLQDAISKAAAANGDPASLQAAKAVADAARGATKKFSANFPGDREGHLDDVVARLMLEPITEAEKQLTPSPIPYNAAGAGLCGSFGPITRKFPFNPKAADEVSLAELGAVFNPKTGKLWEGKFKELIQCSGGQCAVVDKPPVTPNPDFVRFFNQAAKLSFALYGDSGTDPNLQYSLKPLPSDQVTTFSINVNSVSTNLAGGEQKTFVWPGAPKYSFTVDLGLVGSSNPMGTSSFSSLWSPFRYFADAEKMVADGSGYDFTVAVTQGKSGQPTTWLGRPLVFTITVDAKGGSVLFNKDFLQSMKCVSKVVK